MYKLSEERRSSARATQASFHIALIPCVLLLSACSGGSDNNEIDSIPILTSDNASLSGTEAESGIENAGGTLAEPVTGAENLPATSNPDANTDGSLLSGIFVDAPVSGLAYLTESQQGFTGARGEFFYISGENIEFFIGDPFVTGEAWTLGSASAQALMTPLHLAGVQWIDVRVTNLLRLMQSLDTDGDSGNGIQLPLPDVYLPDGSVQPDFSQAIELFQQNSAVSAFISGATGQSALLVDTDQAIEHFQQSLNEQLPEPSGDWVLTEANLSEEALDNLSASISFMSDGQFSATVTQGEFEAQVSGNYTQSNLSFNTDFNRIRLVTSQQQLTAEIGDQQFGEVNSALNDLLPAALKVAIGINANISLLPDLVSLESDDRGIQLRYVQSEQPVVEIASLTLEPVQVDLLSIGEQFQLNVTALAIDESVVSDVSLVWESSDENVVSVSSSGLITANGTGSALVSVTSATVEATINVDVELKQL